MTSSMRSLTSFWNKTEIPERFLTEGEAALPEIVRPFFIAGVTQHSRPLLVVLPRSRDAEAFAASVSEFLPPAEVELFSAWEVLPGESMSPTLETMGRRTRVVRDLAQGRAPALIVSSVRAFLQKVSARPIPSLVLSEGAEFALDELAGLLAGYGFERNYLVERPGEFSVRGGILDVYPATGPPVRADFFGDEITELRRFGVSSQRSEEAVELSEILPVRELRLDEPTRQRAASILEDGVLDEAVSGDLAKISEGVAFPGMEAYLPLLSGPLVSISELLGETGRVVVMDPKQCSDRAADFLAQAAEWSTSVSDGLFAGFEASLAETEALSVWPYARADESLEIPVRSWDEHLGRPDELARELNSLLTKGATVAVAAGRSTDRITSILGDAGLGTSELGPQAGRASIFSAHLEKGFVIELPGIAPLAVVGEGDIFGRRRPIHTKQFDAPARAASLLLELASGDYVVHEVYGVGRYHGMTTRELGGISRDYLIIEYHGDDRLYLPVEHLETITKYTGGEAPRLNRLGTAEWEKAKKRARKAVEDIAGELVVLYSKRQHAPGFAFNADSPWQSELEDAFVHIETPDQERAIEEVKADMEKPIPMDRLICGDVGYGKTEVAVRAAFKAVQDSKQVAVLVPTTILAQQHTQTFSDRFAPYPIKVAQLSRFLTAAEQEAVLERVASGDADVVIGTHRLFQPDVKFHDLGLLIVDEEQRFGVKHKEKIKQLRADVDVLTMTATPIPRTLEMSLTGIRDLSLMDTPPVDRRPVLTYVGESDERMITAAIRRELARDGQVFYVHNRVRSIKGTARRIQGLVPGARVEIAHGQMSEGELERVMVDVWDAKIDVLVCTTIIESGLDIPAMNTLIVERADLLGLSQLYQLRGRVGRSRERAYAYFFYPHDAALSDEAHERLKTLSEFTELGSGFKIALRDLEIRGAGNLLGAEQSGHIAAVGFDLYTRMMGEAISELSGRVPEKELEVRLDIPADAYVPAPYIARESLRMETYRQIEKIRSDEGADALREELIDRYGALPQPVETLIQVAQLRALLASHGIAEATVRDAVMKLRPFPLLSDSQEVRLARKFRDAIYKQLSATLLLPVPAKDTVGWVLSSLRAILA